MEDLLKCDGRKFSAEIEGTSCTGEICVLSSTVYLLQNIKNGDGPTSCRGYSYSWNISQGTDEQLEGNYITNLKLLDYNLLDKDGYTFTATIDKAKASGEIVVQDGRIYLCQNIKKGSTPRDKRGYTGGWSIGKGTFANLRDNGVFDLIVGDKIVPKDTRSVSDKVHRFKVGDSVKTVISSISYRFGGIRKGSAKVYELCGYTSDGNAMKVRIQWPDGETYAMLESELDFDTKAEDKPIPVPTPKFKIGDKVKIPDDSRNFKFGNMSGKILGKIGTICTGANEWNTVQKVHQYNVQFDTPINNTYYVAECDMEAYSETLSKDPGRKFKVGDRVQLTIDASHCIKFVCGGNSSDLKNHCGCINSVSDTSVYVKFDKSHLFKMDESELEFESKLRRVDPKPLYEQTIDELLSSSMSKPDTRRSSVLDYTEGPAAPAFKEKLREEIHKFIYEYPLTPEESFELLNFKSIKKFSI